MSLAPEQCSVLPLLKCVFYEVLPPLWLLGPVGPCSGTSPGQPGKGPCVPSRGSAGVGDLDAHSLPSSRDSKPFMLAEQ